MRRGQHVDRRGLDRTTLKELVDRFVLEELQDGGRQRGATEDRVSHTPCILRDEIAGLTLAQFTPAAVRGFRDRMAAAYAPATVVKRLNLLSGMLSHARAEWDVPLQENPAAADAVRRPQGADRKRDRRLRPVMASQLRDAAERGEDPPLGEEVNLKLPRFDGFSALCVDCDGGGLVVGEVGAASHRMDHDRLLSHAGLPRRTDYA